MAKEIISVDEVLKEIQASHKDDGSFVYNRFNKKNFNKLLLAMMNDSKFTTQVAKAKKDGLDSIEDIQITQSFRKFVKRVVEKFGVDKAESEKILTDEFTFDNAEGLYEFFATAMYLYMKQGNRFDMLPKEDFKASISMKHEKKKTKVSSAYHPKTREYLGDFEVTKKDHDILTVKSPCPVWLNSRKKVK